MELKANESESYRLVNYPGPHVPAELQNAIFGPFLNTLRYGNDMFKLIDKQSYFPNYSIYITNLLSRESSTVTFAMLEDVVLGWCLHDLNTVHYVWVKNEVRRQGIGNSLLPKNFSQISHITNKGMNIWVKKFPEVRFNPWA